MDRQLADISATRKKIEQLSTEIQNLHVVQKMLTEKLSTDPNKAEQIRLERYRSEAERIDDELRQQTLEFISPQEMIEVLRGLIRKESNLRLVSLESIQPEDLLKGIPSEADGGEDNESKSKESDQPTPVEHSGAYLHTLELKFKGDYLTVMRYIQKMESLQWRFIWKSLSIQLEDYPVTHVELQLQTLGLTEGWIGV
jgi:MSHA biogenesis protein MshJ